MFTRVYPRLSLQASAQAHRPNSATRVVESAIVTGDDGNKWRLFVGQVLYTDGYRSIVHKFNLAKAEGVVQISG